MGKRDQAKLMPRASLHLVLYLKSRREARNAEKLEKCSRRELEKDEENINGENDHYGRCDFINFVF